MGSREEVFVRIGVVLVCLVLVPVEAAAQSSVRRPPPAQPTAATASPYCPGEYADDFSALTAQAHKLEQDRQSYTFCIRTSAVYECPSYRSDGSLKRRKQKVVAHGTGFAFRQQGNETLILTNQHVADWPFVTDADHPAAGVPEGCKRVSETLAIVDDESDSYETDNIPLSRVVSDVGLDVAVLKAKAALPVLPWKIGKSAALKERNVVDVRGFPLGVFKATNVGKVVSAYDHDNEKEWDHDDFVVDALLSPGNSGSPVFAISCKTGEFELVGIYHAGYVQGSALNVVVGVDQFRDLMTTLKRTPRERQESSLTLNGAARQPLVTAARDTLEPFFPFAHLTAALRVRDDGTILYEILNRDFPVSAHPILVVEDLPPATADSFGTSGRVWVGNRRGLKAYSSTALDAATQADLARLLEALRRDSIAAFAARAADLSAIKSKKEFQQRERLERTLKKTSASYADVADSALELATRLSPEPKDLVVSLESLFSPPTKNGQPAANLADAVPPPASAPTTRPSSAR
jgi:serine protease Do